MILYGEAVCVQTERIGELTASLLPQLSPQLGEYRATYTTLDEAVEAAESIYRTLWSMEGVSVSDELWDEVGELHQLTLAVASLVWEAGQIYQRRAETPGDLSALRLEDERLWELAAHTAYLEQESERVVSELDPAIVRELYAVCPAAAIPVALIGRVPLPEAVTGAGHEGRT